MDERWDWTIAGGGVSEESEKRVQRRRVRLWYQALLSDLPDGFTPLEAVVSVECLDTDGNVVLLNQKTENCSAWKALGMLISASDDMRNALNSYATEDDE